MFWIIKIISGVASKCVLVLLISYFVYSGTHHLNSKYIPTQQSVDSVVVQDDITIDNVNETEFKERWNIIKDSIVKEDLYKSTTDSEKIYTMDMYLDYANNILKHFDMSNIKIKFTKICAAEWDGYWVYDDNTIYLDYNKYTSLIRIKRNDVYYDINKNVQMLNKISILKQIAFAKSQLLYGNKTSIDSEEYKQTYNDITLWVNNEYNVKNKLITDNHRKYDLN